MKRKIGLIIVLMGMIFTASYTTYIERPKTIKASCLVKQGMVFDDILVTLGYNNRFFNKIYTKTHRETHMIQKGLYRFSGKLNVRQISKILVNGDFEKVTLTIPEGFTLTMVAEVLAQNKLIKTPSVLLNALKGINDFPYYVPHHNFEGYFFPDTYIFYVGEPTRDIIETFLGHFLLNYPVSQHRDKKVFYHQLILASIVQKEVKQPTIMPIIAAIFYNRLETGMRLQSDATITYVTKEKKARLTYKDLKLNSAYNTYRHSGLPPTPICSPGKEAIAAAKNPKKTDYVYFLTTASGDVKFSKTFHGHRQNKTDYLKGQK